MSKKLTVEEIKNKIAIDNKMITLLSRNYQRSTSPLSFTCDVCEHAFKRSWNSMDKPNTHCPACGKNGERITKREIKEMVENEGYVLVEFLGGDSNKGTMFKVQCSRSHIYDTSYREFNREEHKKGGSCKTCLSEGYSKSNKEKHRKYSHTVKELGYNIKDNEPVELLKDTRIFVCAQGHEREIMYSTLLECPSCAECEGRVTRHTEESISTLLTELGLKYVRGFTFTKDSFTYICECGTEDIGLIYDLIKGIRCFKCSNRKYWNYSEVKEFFKKNDCLLLETEYIKSKIPLKFKCSCGRIDYKSFNEYQPRPFCRECGRFNKRRGENHPMWNPNKTDEERMGDRKYPEYKEWRLSVFERDKFTCQCCGDDTGGNLEAHHILNYMEHKEIRIDLDNGITLCDIDHKRFHDIYGYTKNNREQLEEFLAMRKEEIQNGHCKAI